MINRHAISGAIAGYKCCRSVIRKALCMYRHSDPWLLACPVTTEFSCSLSWITVAMATKEFQIVYESTAQII